MRIMTVMGGDVNSISHNGGTVSRISTTRGGNVCSALACTFSFFFFPACTLALLFCRLHFVTVSSNRVLIQEEAALAVLPGAGG